MEENLDLSLARVLEVMQDRLMHSSTYFGVRALKSPLDFWIYQEIIYAMKPDFIVEIGNAYGGATLALAHICDLIGSGQVLAIDISHQNIGEVVKKHPRIRLMEGDATELYPEVRKLIAGRRTLVIEDSSHTYENTLSILNKYTELTHVGDYFIVEDSICHHGLDVGPKPGPYEAVEDFVSKNDSFVIDRSMESFLITWNPKGYLKRVR